MINHHHHRWTGARSRHHDNGMALLVVASNAGGVCTAVPLIACCGFKSDLFAILSAFDHSATKELLSGLWFYAIFAEAYLWANAFRCHHSNWIAWTSC